MKVKDNTMTENICHNHTNKNINFHSVTVLRVTAKVCQAATTVCNKQRGVYEAARTSGEIPVPTWTWAVRPTAGLQRKSKHQKKTNELFFFQLKHLKC